VRRGGVVRRDGPYASSDPQAFPDMDPGDVVVIAARLEDVVGDVEGLKLLSSRSRTS
jgi:hypothetical protein